MSASQEQCLRSKKQVTHVNKPSRCVKSKPSSPRTSESGGGRKYHLWDSSEWHLGYIAQPEGDNAHRTPLHPLVHRSIRSHVLVQGRTGAAGGRYCNPIRRGACPIPASLFVHEWMNILLAFGAWVSFSHRTSHSAPRTTCLNVPWQGA